MTKILNLYVKSSKLKAKRNEKVKDLFLRFSRYVNRSCFTEAPFLEMSKGLK
ncbi:hypothetical protein JOD45_001823 [Scopulibacillus daqui]|uniref:Transposase n=1 Tax=Scopulibacillus daqui TaxID=1469162 RepID=A0ABS2PZX9_9BACL|nr:hypothetical protein [Scopulibacillus daqui]